MKIIINNCYGGFSLSPKAQVEFLKRKGKKAFFYKQTKYIHNDKKEEYVRLTVREASSASFTYTLTKDLGKVVEKLPDDNNIWFNGRDIERNNPDLIAIVEEMGNDASGSCANLKIVKIPDDVEWEIDEYDGNEWVSEKHKRRS